MKGVAKRKKSKTSETCYAFFFRALAICIVIVIITIQVYRKKSIDDESNTSNTAGENEIIGNTLTSFEASSTDLKAPVSSIECTDPIWCNVKIPVTSHFGFKPPHDRDKWTRAQMQAANGEQILLKYISQVFPFPFDFLDGDRQFRKLHSITDVFIDERTWLGPLTKSGLVSTDIVNPFPWQKDNRTVIPSPYDFRSANRSPIAQLGYMAFQKDKGKYFSGNFEGGAWTTREKYFTEWKMVKDDIDKPYITICIGNENWGWLSSHIPNRTAGWGACCDRPGRDNFIKEFLDDEKTLMVVINQHSNISHPKILTLPRGLPLTWEHTERLIWDAIRNNIKHVKKDKLLFAASSSWGKRPQIINCISQKFSPDDFEGHISTPKSEIQKTKLDRSRYYSKLSSSKFGLALPGLGYDCFRTWELLTMGSAVVIERGTGLDKSFWRLPVLLVDDFADITPGLLRSAYVEAVYRAADFEFERLKQSFWWSVILNVSVTGNIAPLLEKFPIHAEDTTFTRPREPYACGYTNTCGKGTKRIPLKTC